MKSSETLKAAFAILIDGGLLDPFGEYLETEFIEDPASIQIPHLGQIYRFGEADDCFGYDILDEDGQLVCDDDLIGLEATPAELAEAIRETVELV
jgi:hypothetical protein